MTLECNQFFIDIIEKEHHPVCCYLITAYDVMVELNVTEEVASVIVERMRESNDAVWQSIWRDAHFEYDQIKAQDPLLELIDTVRDSPPPNPENGEAVSESGKIE